ncbi:hypothetical protein [Gloeobacter morelensis]|uniref:Uncharacterized protein n=1 Tax=Gloeobacter morelensis MG652769 TaxID=2781736 RepID=A0ABY3PK69_9CYAN|nr:hypothetical protein [Gloeobacter morelensis]UFP94056.1 hypothetical protein ISF26_20175 [Gloeobacter morelensis MG652769]
MFRKKSSVVPVAVFRRLCARLDEVEQTLDELLSRNERLERQNQALELQVRRLSLKLSEAPLPAAPLVAESASHRAAAARPRMFTKWTEPAHEAEGPPTPQFAAEKSASPEGPGWLFWMLTLLVAAAAGVGTFYLVRPLTFGL